MRPYDVATFPYDVAMFLYDVATYLHDVLMLRTEGLDRFRGLPSYVRFGRSDRTQKRHGTTVKRLEVGEMAREEQRSLS